MSNKSAHKFRKLIPGRCRYCDRRFFYRHGTRPRIFCDQKCRQGDFRLSGYLHPKNDETCRKSEINSKISKADFADRPLVNVRPARLDRELWHNIVETEMPEGRTKLAPPSAPNPYTAEIPADLSIPTFLKRRPA